MKLNPSAKSNRRYVLLEAQNQANVIQAITDYVGALGFAKADPIFIKKLEKNRTILAVNREEIINVRASFALSQFEIKVLKVSGTIKGLG